LSLFGVEARPASPLDLEGLLAGAGQVVRMGGTARVSIVVPDPWRARALLRETALRGLAATCEKTEDEGHIAFRTAYSTVLAPLGNAWLRGAIKHPRRGFALDGRRLRLWVIASGRPEKGTFTLGLGAGDSEETWSIAGSALRAAGLPAVLLGPGAGGPAYRIVGRRRLARLAELVGDPPPETSSGQWV
jgi:hypothetical protein